MSEADDTQFLCEWNGHWVYRDVMGKYLKTGDFSDVTVQLKDGTLRCHKIILSACSPFFEDLLLSNKSSAIAFYDITKDEFKPILDYLYVGNVMLPGEQLKPFLRLAKRLHIRGITEEKKDGRQPSNESTIRKCSASSSPVISSDDSPGGSNSSFLQSKKKQNKEHTDVYEFKSDSSSDEFEILSAPKKYSRTSYSSKTYKEVGKVQEPVHKRIQQLQVRNNSKLLANPPIIDLMCDHAVVID